MKKLGSFLMNLSLWRPGARLMQRLRFPAKMALISVAFLLPLVWVLTAYMTTKWEGIHYVQRERDGVRYVEAIYPTLEAAGLWRIQALMAATGEPGASTDEARRKFDEASPSPRLSRNARISPESASCSARHDSYFFLSCSMTHCAL